MSAGEEVDAAYTAAARACGLLILLIVKRRLSREVLTSALSLLEESASRLRAVLGK